MEYYVSKSTQESVVKEIWTPGGVAIKAKKKDQDVRLLTQAEKDLFKACESGFQTIEPFTYCPVSIEFVCNLLNINNENDKERQEQPS